MYADKVRKGWELALNLRDEGDLNNSASRMYYAVFLAALWYAVAKRSFDPLRKTNRDVVHARMKAYVEEHFKERTEYVRCYGQLRRLRNKADYEPVDVSPSELDLEFINKIQCIKDFFLREVNR